MTVASWLVVMKKGRGPAVRRALARPGIECRSEAYDTLVVVTESTAGTAALETLRRLLAAIDGVREVVLVARFEDDTRPPASAPCPAPTDPGAFSIDSGAACGAH